MGSLLLGVHGVESISDIPTQVRSATTRAGQASAPTGASLSADKREGEERNKFSPDISAFRYMARCWVFSSVLLFCPKWNTTRWIEGAYNSNPMTCFLCKAASLRTLTARSSHLNQSIQITNKKLNLTKL